MCILIKAISFLCSCESQSFPGCSFRRKQTFGDTILNCLTFSIRLLSAQLVLLQGLSFWGAELNFSFDSASFFDSASYFGTLFGFESVSYMHMNRKNSLVFLFSSPSSTEWHMIGYSFSRFLLKVF